MIAAILLALAASPDTLLVEVQVVGVGSQVLTAVLQADSTLWLPAHDLNAFLGRGQPTSAWTTPAALQREEPALTVTWVMRELRVVIEDPSEVLPVTRAFREKVLRSARGAAPITTTRGGLFASVLADQDLDSAQARAEPHWATEAGYSFAGRVAVQARHSSVTGAAWAVSVAPVRGLYATYSQGEHQRPTASARVAVGPLWVSGAWASDKFDGSALVAVGPFSVYAAPWRDQYLITVRGPADFQLGVAGRRVAGRISFGPVLPSPFSVPLVQ